MTNDKGMERLVFFSDAVFAIAITLLGLELTQGLKAPEGPVTDAELLKRLFDLGPKCLGYVFSFLVIGMFWIIHHQRFCLIKRCDTMLLFLNLLLLMAIAFIPFPTAVASEYVVNRTATIFYALTIMVTSVLSAAIWWYASCKQLIVSNLSPEERCREKWGYLLPLLGIFSVSIVLAFFNVYLAKLFWLIAAVVLLFMLLSPGKK